MLHIVPTYSPSTYNNGAALNTNLDLTMTDIPHFVYDLVEKKWSKHHYDSAASDIRPLDGSMLLWTGIGNGANSTGCKSSWQRPFLIRRPTGGPATYMQWDLYGTALSGCESQMQFRTGTIVPFEDTAHEAKLCRVMIVYRTSVDNVVGNMKVDYMQGNLATQIDIPQVSKDFNMGQSGPYNRLWINCVVVGNFFQFTFTFPGETEIMIREVVFEFDQTGQEVRTEGV